MSTAVAGATIHHLAGTRPGPLHPRTGDHELSTGDISEIVQRLASIETKLDERATATAERLAAMTAATAAAVERQREDKRALWAAIEELRARPRGLTGRGLLGALGAGVAVVVGAIEIITRVHLS